MRRGSPLVRTMYQNLILGLLLIEQLGNGLLDLAHVPFAVDLVTDISFHSNDIFGRDLTRARIVCTDPI